MSLQPLSSREPDRSGKVVPLLPGPVFDGLRPSEPRRVRERALGWNWLAVSVLAHLVVVEALLFGLGAPEPPPPVPVLRIALIPEGPGSAGAAAGNNAASEATPQAEAAPPAPQPPEPEATPPEPTPPVADAPPPEPVPVPEIEAPPPPPVQAVAPPPAPELKPEPVPDLPKPPPEKPRVAQNRPRPKPKAEIARAPPPAPAPPAPSVATLTPPVTTGAPGPVGASRQGLGTQGAGNGAIGQTAGPGDEYLDRLYKHLLRFKKYPADAQQRKEQGSVVVGFTIGRDGTLSNARVEKSSGFAAIDVATIEMLNRASPAPPLPESYKATEARVKIPINYKLGVADELL